MACFFLVLYSTITSYEFPASWYHAQVSYQITFAASVLFVPFMFAPGWRIETLAHNLRPWLAVSLCLGLATIFSADPVVSVPGLRMIYSVMLFGFILRAWLWNHSRVVVPGILLSIALVHAAILSLVFFAYGHVSGDLLDFRAWLPYHSHIRHVGYHGAIAACSGLAFSLLVPRFRLVGLFLSTLALFGLIFFGSRGALLAWLVFVGVAAYWCDNKRHLLLTAAVMLLVAWIAGLGFSSLMVSHIGTVADRAFSIASSESRLLLWRDALVAIIDRPLLGYGPEGYLSSHCCPIENTQTHNAILEIAIETGVLGLLAFAWLAKATIGSELIRLWQQRKAGQTTNPERALIFSMIISMITYSMYDGISYHVVPLLIFSVLCALLFSIPDDDRNFSERKP